MSQFLLVSYDIPDDKRRLKVMKTLEGFGSRVQYSVFECRLKSPEIDDLRKRLRKLATRVDSIRIYYLCQEDTNRIEVMGNGGVTPDSIFYMH